MIARIAIAWVLLAGSAHGYEPKYLPPLIPEEELGPVEAEDVPPIVVEASAPVVVQESAPLLPPVHVPQEPLRFAVLALLAALGARMARRSRDGLRPQGLLAPVLALVHGTLAMLAVGCGLVAIAAWLPAWLLPALPVAVLGAGLAVGWSARELLWDMIAGVVVRLEHRVQPGNFVTVPGQAGVVEMIGLRATWLRDAADNRIAVPNRALLSGPVTADADRWPQVEIELDGPVERRRLEEVVLTSPWVAPRPDLLVSETAVRGRWRVRVRVLEGRFAPRFEAVLRERVRG